MSRSYKLSGLQAAVMQVLWERGEATVQEVHEALRGQRSLAPTTVATVLSRLEKRGFLSHRSEGRQYVYRPEISAEEVRRSMVADLAEHLFQGDVTALVSHLLSEQELGPGELERLRGLVEARTRETEQGDAHE